MLINNSITETFDSSTWWWRNPVNINFAGRRDDQGSQSGFLPVRTVPVLGLVLHVLFGLEPRTALPGTRARGTSTVPVLAVLYLKWRISLILINLRFIFFESHLLLVNSYQYWWLSYLIMLLKVQDNGFLQELYLLIYQIKRKIYHIKV